MLTICYERDERMLRPAYRTNHPEPEPSAAERLKRGASMWHTSHATSHASFVLAAVVGCGLVEHNQNGSVPGKVAGSSYVASSVYCVNVEGHGRQIIWWRCNSAAWQIASWLIGQLQHFLSHRRQHVVEDVCGNCVLQLQLFTNIHCI